MAISRVAGQMLNSNLQRDGVNLAVETNLLYIDVNNNRVGIKTSSPETELHVLGNILSNNLSATANVTAGNVNGTTVTATANITGGNVITTGIVAATGNIYSDIFVGNNAIIANVDIGNLVNGGNIVVESVTANLYMTTPGNITGGNLITPSVVGNTELTLTSTSAGNIYIDPDSTGQLQIIGTNGFVIPVGTTGERPGSPLQGTVRFNTTNSQMEVWDGATWIAATNEQSIITNQTITGDSSNSTFTLDQATTADSILVTINGIAQTPSIDYTVTGNSISFTTTPIVTDIIQVRFIASTTAISGVVLPIYTVTQAQALPSVATGEVIYVSNGDSGTPCLAVYSGGAFKRISLGANIST